MRISDLSSDVCSSDLAECGIRGGIGAIDTRQAGRCGDTGRLKLNVSEFGSKGGDVQPAVPAAPTPLQLCAGFIISHLLRSKALKGRENRGKPRGVPCARAEIGRAHVCTPVTNAHLV